MEKSNRGERKETERIMPLNTGHYVLPAMPMVSALTSLGPIFCELDVLKNTKLVFWERHFNLEEQGCEDIICSL